MRSYIGFPLTPDDQLVGTLELGQLTQGTLGQQDFELIQLVSPQVAYSLRNAALYEAEQQLSSELGGLANLAQAIEVSHNYGNLINRLIESITPLFPVDVLGFLLYDEGKKTLEAQSPFHGLPVHIVDIYRASIPSNSPAETVIIEKKVIATRNATSDPTRSSPSIAWIPPRMWTACPRAASRPGPLAGRGTGPAPRPAAWS